MQINPVDKSNDLKKNKISLFIKNFFVVSTSLFFTLSIILALYLLSEKYFFDKLFYKKSIFHGYYNIYPNKVDDWQIIAKKFNYDRRNSDLLNLIFAEQGDERAIANLAKERDASHYKIAIIGDSMPFGLGVRKNQTLAHYLQKIINNENGLKIYDYSYTGDDILDNYIKYRLIKKYLEPDLIILGLVDNDLVFDNVAERYPGKMKLFKELNEVCEGKELVLWEKGVDDVFRSVFHPSFQKDTQNYCFLEKLAVNFSEENLILLNYGCLYPNLICEKDNDEICCLELEIYKNYLSAFNQNSAIVDFCDIEIKSVSEKEFHYSSYTNFEIAKKLADFIEVMVNVENVVPEQRRMSLSIVQTDLPIAYK